MNQTALAPVEQVQFGKASLAELVKIVKERPNKVTFKDKKGNSRTLMELSDWETLGAFTGVSAGIEHGSVEPLYIGESKELVGWKAAAQAFKDGKVISRAEAICLFKEENRTWTMQHAHSMAQTRAIRKALSSVLLWIVKLPQGGKNEPVVVAAPEDEQSDAQPEMFKEGGNA